MKGIPPEIDALMWRLAEEGGPAAVAEFETRHIKYAPELSRRVKMVTELRQAGRTVVHRPTFTPRPQKVAPTPRWVAASAIGLGVLAVGSVAYVLASSGQKPEPVPPIVVPAPTNPKPEPEPNPVATVPKPDPVVVNPPPAVEPKPEKTPDYLKPRDVNIADTNLAAAIQLVAQSGGLKVTVAPGFVNQKVTFHYEGLSTVDTLKTMGEEYGFSVFEQEEGHVLVVPARAPNDQRRVGP